MLGTEREILHITTEKRVSRLVVFFQKDCRLLIAALIAQHHHIILCAMLVSVWAESILFLHQKKSGFGGVFQEEEEENFFFFTKRPKWQAAVDQVECVQSQLDQEENFV